MRLVFTLAAALLIALCGASAHATTDATDQTDFWWSVGESGWAINVAHQYDTVFITFYVYGQDGRAIWYSGSAPLSASGSQGLFYVGNLYESTGPWFGLPGFNASLVPPPRQVGTFTFNPRTLAEAALSYSVDGVTVNKTVQRFTFRVNRLDGNYLAALAGAASGCTSNGAQLQSLLMQVTHDTDNRVRVVLGSQGDSCVIDGTYQQFGRLGHLTGTIQCNNGPIGDYSLSEIDASLSGITAQFSQVSGTCRVDGNIAAARR